MPSPFPGMDPYLEGEFWTGFHAELIIEIKRQLIPRLQPRYYPFIEKYQVKTLVSDLGVAMEPDIAVSRTSKASMAKVKSAPARGAVAMTLPLTLPVPQTRIAIRDVAKRKLVTIIEVLSPGNKVNPGRRKYLRKRGRILASSVHLIEIDLLRGGQRPPMVEPYPEGCYFVIVSRSNQRPRSDVWSISLDAQLPMIPIPLLPKDLDVPLELQDAFTRAYDLGSFKQIIRYQKPPDRPLTEEQNTWTNDLLRRPNSLN